MTEEAKDAGKPGEESATPEEGAKAIYTQADMDAIESKIKTGAAKRIADMEKKLAAFEEATKSEQEKALDAAKAAGRAEIEAELASQSRLSAIQLGLVQHGYSPEQASRLAKVAKEDLEPEAAALELLEAYGEVKAGRPKAGGGGNPPGPDSQPDFSLKGVQEKLASMSPEAGREWLKKHQRDIDAHRAKTLGMGKSLAPGEGLSFTEARKG